MKSILTKLMLISSVAVLGAFNQGCSDEAAIGIGAGVTGIILGSAIERHRDHDYIRECRPGYVTRCNTYYDYYGRAHRQCRDVYDSCVYRYGNTLHPEVLEDFGIFPMHNEKLRNEKVYLLASSFQFPDHGAERLWEALDRARHHDLSGVHRLGLTHEDLQTLATKKSLPAPKLDALARNLGTSPQNAQSFIREMAQEFQRQGRNLNSPLWRHCVTSGHWMTNRNRSCKDTLWNGCSPQTGATICGVRR